jgi:hypothetical protein
MDKTPPSIPLAEQITYMESVTTVVTPDHIDLAILSSLKELQESRVYAARYRWLREQQNEGGMAIINLCKPKSDWSSCYSPDTDAELDAAIDAALPPSADKGPK